MQRTFRGNTRSVGPNNGQFRSKSPNQQWVNEVAPMTQMISKNHVEGVFYEGILNQEADKFSGVNESQCAAANGKYVAVPWAQNDGYGAVMVTEETPDLDFAENPRYRVLTNEQPLVIGHKGKISDLAFSPHFDNVLATASVDATVKVWVVPEDGGMVQDMREGEEYARLAGHAKTVTFAKWNPQVGFLMATASRDQSMKIWDVKNSKGISSYKVSSGVSALEWNADGQVLACSQREGNLLSFFDPRAQKKNFALSLQPDALKQIRMKWLGDTGKFVVLSTAFEKGRGRYVQIFDMRTVTKGPIFAKKLDSYDFSNVDLHYEKAYGNGLFYVVNRGYDFCQYFNFGQHLNKLSYLGKHVSQKPIEGMTFLPQRTHNFAVGEVSRAFTLYDRQAEYVSFYKHGGDMLDQPVEPVKDKEPTSMDDWRIMRGPVDATYVAFEKAVTETALATKEWLSPENAWPVSSNRNFTSYSPSRRQFDPVNRTTNVSTDQPWMSPRATKYDPKNAADGRQASAKQVIYDPETSKVSTVEVMSARQPIQTMTWQGKNEQDRRIALLEQKVGSQQLEIEALRQSLLQVQQTVAELQVRPINRTYVPRPSIDGLKKPVEPSMAVMNAVQQFEQPEGTIPNEEVVNQPPVLGHWDIRGLAQAIRYQLVYSGVEFDDFYHYHSDDPALTQDSWLRKKDRLGLDFPSLPYFIDGNYKLSEHLAIHEYIADKWMPELLGKSKTARAQVSMLANVVSGIRKFVDDVCHSGSLTQRQLSGEIISKFEPIGQMLVGKTFLLGDDLSYMDFYLFELLQLADYITQGEIYAAYKHLDSYQYAISQLPRLKRYLQSPNFISAPFNLKFARINNWRRVV